MNNLCPQCGAPIDPKASKCGYCGAALQQQPVQPVQPVYTPGAPVYTAPAYTAPVNVTVNAVNERANWPIKNKIVAALLAIFLGSLGIHKFYLGQKGKGILYLIFFWTYIPGILAFIEGITMLCSNDENFMIKYRCRLG